jgi:hypothetical protein
MSANQFQPGLEHPSQPFSGDHLMLRLSLCALVLFGCSLFSSLAQAQIKTINGEMKAGQPENIEEMKLKAGDTLLLRMNSADFDTFIRIRDENNQEVAADDDGGEGLNSKLVYKVEKDGAYKIVATSFGNNGVGNYTLDIVNLGQLKSIGKPFEKASKIDGNSKTLRNLPYESHFIKMEKGKAYQIDYKSTAFDPILGVRLKGTEKFVDGDDDGGEGLNSKLLFIPTETGEYELLLGSFNKQQGDFTLTIQEMGSETKKKKVE